MNDTVIRNGRIIDPSQDMDMIGSIIINNGIISKIDKNENDEPAKNVLDAGGKIVTPGFIDLHCHPSGGFCKLGVREIDFGLRNAVVLLCDAGSCGCDNFEGMCDFIVKRSQTDMLCFLNLCRTGLVSLPEIWDERNIDLDMSKKTIEENKDTIIGVKLRIIQPLLESIGMRAVEMAKKLSLHFSLPLMLHIGESRPRIPNEKMDEFSRSAVSTLDNNDILSHYLTWEAGGLILEDGFIYPELIDAKKRGVVLDSCHGLNHFSFSIARHAIDEGLVPTVISTDLALPNIQVVQSLPVTMSKFLNMGISLYDVIKMATFNPAKVLLDDENRGNLKVGKRANIAISELISGNFIFSDGANGEKLIGSLLLEPRLLIKDGKSMPAFSGYSIPSSISTM